MKNKYLLLLVFLISCGQLFAGLRFEEVSKEHKADPDDKFAVVNYAFTNDGGQEVKIVKIDSDCSCLSGATDKAEYAAGEKGTISLKYKTGTLKGTARKFVTVITSDGQRQKLEAIVTVPELLTIKPRTLKWRTTDAVRSKQIVVEADGDNPMNITHVQPSSKDFDIEIKTEKEGHKYLIIATPKNISSPQTCLLRIETDSKIKRFRVNQAFLVVNKSAPRQR